MKEYFALGNRHANMVSNITIRCPRVFLELN
jgi:hypothetical protein